MNAGIATAGLFALVGALFLIPLIPAFVELRLKRDAQALNVIQQYAGDIRHFSFGFRGYAAELMAPLHECVASGTMSTGTLPRGDRYLLMGCSGPLPLVHEEDGGKTCDLIVVTGAEMALPDDLTFSKEIYATRKLTGGSGCTYRAILGEASVHLGRNSNVTRWVHAAGPLLVEENCDLYGRVSSDLSIGLMSGCVFQRLNAPQISFGPRSIRFGDSADSLDLAPSDAAFAGVAATRRLVDGDLEIAPREVVKGSIVTRGSLRIGPGAQIIGSLKSNGSLIVEAGARVQGSVISMGAMHVGPDCRIAGPVIAEHELAIASGTHCGTLEKPTTVSAPACEIEEGVVVFGTIWARQEGHVVAR